MTMLIRFYASMTKELETSIGKALMAGMRAYGDKVEMVPNCDYTEPDPSVDVAMSFGVKAPSRALVDDYRAIGKRVIVIDKAMIRVLGKFSGHYRFGLDGLTPNKYLMREMRSFDRWESLRFDMKPKQERPNKAAILYAGSSQKYCDWYGLGDANDYAEDVFRQCRDIVRKQNFIYRPKPSWTAFREIEGTTLSRPPYSMKELLPRTSVVVTHGSSAALDAIMHGVPAITLGPCVANIVCGSSLEDLRDPPFPSEGARFQFMCAVAYAQWTIAEMASGQAWGFMRKELEATA